MGKWLLAVSIFFLGGLMAIDDAQARRLGGARSLGIQRSITPPAKPAPQKAAPQQAQNAPAASGSRWGGILGGLALGGLLGYLFGGSGLLGVLFLALLAVAAFAAIGALARRRVEAGSIQFAGGGSETVAMPMASRAAPPGFDTAGFLRAAKINFIRLQAANDAGRLDDIRELTTNEMFEALRADSRAGRQHTDVVTLDADLLELATENDQHWASVRFSGSVREAAGSEPAAFEEVWNLVKPVDGSSGWLLAGIQQMH